MADCGEHALIARILSRVTTPSWVALGPGDDAAALEPVSGALDVVTTDAQVDGVHFDRRFVAADAIGHRALAVNLSDLAAMGARPRAALLSLALPPSLELTAFDQMLDGFFALAARHQVALVGGNVTSTPGPLMLDVTAMGAAHRRKLLTRAGARPGDEVWVTGTVGDAAAGLARLQSCLERGADPFASAIQDEAARYLRPEPRVRAGMLLGRNRAASACMDLSDGLADGLRQVAEASGVGITVDGPALPISPGLREWAAQTGRSAIDLAIRGGDDFELLFTTRRGHYGRLRSVRQQLGELTITRIGVVTRSRHLLVKDEQGTRELPAGYEHFRERG